MQANQLFAEDLLKITGPGKMLLLGEEPSLQHLLGVKGNRTQTIHWVENAFVASNSAPIDDEAPLLCVIVSGETLLACGDHDSLMQALYRLHPRFVVLRFESAPMLFSHPQLRQESFWADVMIRQGFRRCLASYRVGDYERYNVPLIPVVQYFESIESAALEEWPLERILETRDLHMDMSREFSSRSDAHIVRYALAAEWVRPGDTVLDCACGLGYGSALLAARSAGRRFIAVDIDETAIRYAYDHFAGRYGVEYRQSPGEQLGFLSDQSIDTIVSFETIEHVPDYLQILQEFARVLKPDGRLIASVPNLWVDETGEDPNPYHFHSFDYKKISDAIGRHFIVEARYTQEAQGGFKLWDSPRSMRSLALPADEPDTEWWVIVATANPFIESKAGYKHPQFHSEHALPPVADFGRYYDNPWLYRVMVQMGERVRDENVLREVALAVLQQAEPHSADFGAALCVLGYQIVLHEDRENAIELLNLASAYLSEPARQPHVLRWQISITYLCALLNSLLGRRDETARFFDIARKAQVEQFSSLLATKVVAAAFWRGVMHLVENEPEAARGCFQEGIESARSALHADDFSAIGDSGDPLAFGFQELAEVADMASQCANALHWQHKYQAAPGFFWQKIDTRRFGLATWLLHLERENENLRARLT
jgi:ubiquinone/menaquinone biosynthesis C-methylase UbiE